MPSSACKTKDLRSEEHTSELQSHDNLVCRLLLANKAGQEDDEGVEHALYQGECAHIAIGHVADLVRQDRFDLFLAHGFFNDTATAEIYTLSLHDALPI